MQLQTKWLRLPRALVLLWAFIWYATNAQQLPENTCGQYFQYLRDGQLRGWYGEVTLSSLQPGDNHLNVRFVQLGKQDMTIVGALEPYPDQQTVLDNIAQQRIVKFRLSLTPDAMGLLPKLTRLVVNNAELCQASDYSPKPHSFFNRDYHISLSRSEGRIFKQQQQQQFDVTVQTVSYEIGKQGQPVVSYEIGQQGQQLPQFPVIGHVFPPPQPNNRQIPTATPVAATWPPAQPASTQNAVTKATELPAHTTWQTTMSWAPRGPQITTTATNPSVPIADSFVPKLEQSVICGQEGSFAPFIYKGRSFPRGKYPWMTAVFLKEVSALAFKCGGSLVSNRMVITAAHCVYMEREDRVVVSLGRYDLDDYNEDGSEGRNVLRILTHPEYSTRLVPDADIAMLTLNRVVVFNDVISPICLWTEPTTLGDGLKGTIAGWGVTEHSKTAVRFPSSVEATIANAAECERNWAGLSKTSDRSFCAGNLDGSGPCTGDSGGGMMVKRNNRWELRGIVSLGYRGKQSGCDLDKYVLFCDLAKHISWLTNNLI